LIDWTNRNTRHF